MESYKEPSEWETVRLHTRAAWSDIFSCLWTSGGRWSRLPSVRNDVGGGLV